MYNIFVKAKVHIFRAQTFIVCLSLRKDFLSSHGGEN